MYEKVCEILMNYVEEPEGGLTPELTFMEDLGMSSLDIMTMVGDIEDEFDITIETSELRAISTLADLAAFLEEKQ